MTIGRDELLRVAELASLRVPEAELASLVGQVARIMDYVEQLAEVPAANLPPLVLGPPTLALRDDVVAPRPLARGPAALAPEWRDGFFVVPVRGAGDDE